MSLFGRDTETCADCGSEVPGGREFGATACRCKNCRKAWHDRAEATIARTKANSELRRKAEEETDRTY